MRCGVFWCRTVHDIAQCGSAVRCGSLLFPNAEFHWKAAVVNDRASGRLVHVMIAADDVIGCIACEFGMGPDGVE